MTRTFFLAYIRDCFAILGFVFAVVAVLSVIFGAPVLAIGGN